MLDAAGCDKESDRPEPRGVDEALYRMNRTRDQVRGAAKAIIHHRAFEYDQNDIIPIEYDTAVDLAEAFLAVIAVADRQERIMRVALDLHGPHHPAYAVLYAGLDNG